VAQLERRFGARKHTPSPLNVSVVVCTHRRASYLTDLLAAVRELDPVPHEVIVVDNDPGPDGCQPVVEAAGARYVREDRKGLNNARNAGLRASRGDVVAFTDDDCVPPPGWLRTVPELFDDPTVAAATGPALPSSLDAPAQVRFEKYASFTRGRNRRVVDWTTLPPVHAGQMGSGNNMLLRRCALNALGLQFAPELDAGTPTESGGDTYMLYRLLAAGHRVAYEPAAFVFHQHRQEPEALHRTIRGYGTGAAAALAKATVDDRELEAPFAWVWLPRQYVEAVGRRLVGRGDAMSVRIAWDYLLGGLEGWWKWPRSRLAQARLPPPPSPGRAPHQDPPADAPAQHRRAGSPVLSVVVPTAGRPDQLARCLSGLPAQTIDEPFEVIVVDDGRIDQPAAQPGPRPQLDLRLIATSGVGAAQARNAGARAARSPLLVFLDDDVVPHPELLQRHLAHHGDGVDRLVIGYCAPRPRERNLAAQMASLWWEDHFRRKRDAMSMTFAEVLTGNTSIRAAAFERIGGFDPEMGRHRREDWEWGIRALNDGVEVVYDHEATGAHEFSLTTRRRVEDTHREGYGDALLIARYPFVIPALPARLFALGHRPPLMAAIMRVKPLHDAVIALLELLERMHARRLWLRLFSWARAGAYYGGLAAADGHRAVRRAVLPRMQVSIDGTEPVPPPSVAGPFIEPSLSGAVGELVTPIDGQWHSGLPQECVKGVRAHLSPTA
jgi:glycosyltransferase involved in cell wall biosynthesis